MIVFKLGRCCFQLLERNDSLVVSLPRKSIKLTSKWGTWEITYQLASKCSSIDEIAAFCFRLLMWLYIGKLDKINQNESCLLMLEGFDTYFDDFLNIYLGGPVISFEPLKYDRADLVIIVTSMDHVSFKQLVIGRWTTTDLPSQKITNYYKNDGM